MPVDFGRTVADYTAHRAPFPERFFLRLEGRGIEISDRHALDLGTGTGTLARALARRGANVVAIDPSFEMLLAARRLDREARVSVRYLQGEAEAIGLARSTFDLIVAGQCWWWFDARRAFAEVQRLLVAGGTLVIASYDWLPIEGRMVALTEELIQRHNPNWAMGGGNGIHAEWPTGAAAAGFDSVETFSTDLVEPYSHAGWRGRVRASAGVGASLTPDRIARFDADLERLLAERFPSEPMYVEHRLFCLVARSPVRPLGKTVEEEAT